jgi:hypothetical protein|tara:strand:- start:160 stop:465 length:306 start_codon:yes stop_codon:yes gene_type:complete
VYTLNAVKNKIMGCIGLKGQALKDCQKGLKFTLLAQARQNTNRANLVDSRTSATKRDSTQYREGFKMGRAGKKPSKIEIKYQGENEYKKMGRWEGQNKKNK